MSHKTTALFDHTKWKESEDEKIQLCESCGLPVKRKEAIVRGNPIRYEVHFGRMVLVPGDAYPAYSPYGNARFFHPYCLSYFDWCEEDKQKWLDHNPNPTNDRKGMSERDETDTKWKFVEFVNKHQ